MNNDRKDMNPVSGNMPDPFDRTMESLTTHQDVTATRPTTIRSVPTFGIGGTLSYIVQTFRIGGDIIEEEGDKVRRGPAKFTVALEVAIGERLQRIIVPNDVLDVIIRQRDSLTTTAMRRVARATAASRKARGIVPDLTKARAALRKKRKK